MKNSQRGLSLIGLLVVSFMLVLAALVGIKSLPAVVEYWNVRKVLNTMVSQGDLATSPAEIRKSFDRRAIIDDITTIKGSDLQITKTGDGHMVSFAYEQRVKLVGPVSLLFEFDGTSVPNGAPRAR